MMKIRLGKPDTICRAHHAERQWARRDLDPEADQARVRANRAQRADGKEDELIAAVSSRTNPPPMRGTGSGLSDSSPATGAGESCPGKRTALTATRRTVAGMGCFGCYTRDLRKIAEPMWRELGIDQDRCLYCGKKPATDVEHVVPRSRGGRDVAINLVPSCADCNRGKDGKHAKEVHEWLKTRSLVPFSQGLAEALSFARFEEGLISGRNRLRRGVALAA